MLCGILLNPKREKKDLNIMIVQECVQLPVELKHFLYVGYKCDKKRIRIF